jgi:hypothetical protein
VLLHEALNLRRGQQLLQKLAEGHLDFVVTNVFTSLVCGFNEREEDETMMKRRAATKKGEKQART